MVPYHQQPWHSICPCVWSFPFIWVSVALEDSCFRFCKMSWFFFNQLQGFLGHQDAMSLFLCSGLVGEKMVVMMYSTLSTEPLGIHFSEYQNRNLFIDENVSENVVCEMVAILSRGDLSHTNGCWCPHSSCYLGPLLLTWFNFNPSVDK